jgi:cobalt-zinc-cadmium efflux system outer membrane protein
MTWMASFVVTVILAINGADPTAYTSQDTVDVNRVPVTLQDYLQYSALNNAGLKAAFEQWKAAVEQVPQVKSLPDPKFTYGYFIREVETRVGPQKQRVGFSQMFPWFGKIEARTDAAAAAARAAKKRYEAAKINLFYEVKEGFYEYVYLAKAVEVARENFELVRHFEDVARTKYMAAAAGHPDLIRAQVELVKLEDHLQTLEQLRVPIVARLNAVMNRQSAEILPWPKKGRPEIVHVNRAKMIALLKEQNPELQALEFEIDSARSRVRLAEKKSYPDIGVGVDWIETDPARMAGVQDSGRDPVILMFTMNIPIWGQSYKAAQMQAEANVRKTSHQKIQTQNTLIARAEQTLYDYEDSQRKMKLYSEVLVSKAQELVRASEAAYRTGKVDFLSLLNAQQKLLEFQLRYERAVADAQQTLAELEMLVGAELEGFVEPGIEER